MMTQGSAAKKAKCGRTQIVRTSDHVPSHKIDQSEVLYSTCASPARGEERGQGESQIQLSPFTHTHTEGDEWGESVESLSPFTPHRRGREGGEMESVPAERPKYSRERGAGRERRTGGIFKSKKLKA